MELACQLWGQISMCLPMQGGGCRGTVSLLAQDSCSVLSQGRIGKGQGTGSLPTVGDKGQGSGICQAPGQEGCTEKPGAALPQKETWVLK